MSERYEPKSDFLKNFDFETVPLSDNEFGQANLSRLIALMNDADHSNRDWATFLLAMSEVCTDEAINALLQRTEDNDADIKAEAVLGLAKRRHPKSLELLKSKLEEEESIGLLDLEAAGCLADSSLLSALNGINSAWHSEPPDDGHVELMRKAILSCQDGNAEEHGFDTVGCIDS